MNFNEISVYPSAEESSGVLLWRVSTLMKRSVSGLKIYEIVPERLTPQVQVAACCLEINNKLLLLQHYQTMVVKKRSGASVNVYLILKRGNKILFHLRKNTGYCDGMWSLVAGHVENGESATAAMIRETYEEIGLKLSPEQITVVHVMHRQTNRLNVDVFFDCPLWEGTIQNCEPEKCEKLEFFALENLPINIVDYNAVALKAVLNEEFYSEQGWD